MDHAGLLNSDRHFVYRLTGLTLCSGSVKCQCCATDLKQPAPSPNSNSSPTFIQNSSTDCPWYGIMCQHFCSRWPLAYSPDGAINCSGHGACDPLSGAFCICDPNYVTTAAGSCAVFLAPPSKPMDPALWCVWTLRPRSESMLSVI